MCDQSDQNKRVHSDIEVGSEMSETSSDNPVDQAEVRQDQPPPAKRQRLCQYWHFRFTAHKVDQKSLKDLLDDMAVAYGFQEEQGTGKHKVKHFQGTIDVGPSRARWSQLEKKFQSIAKEKLEFPAKDYLEKSDSSAAKRYAMKEDTRIDGPWFKGVDFEEIAEETVVPEYRIDIELRQWQQKIVKYILDAPPNDRDIWCLWEPNGGLGKTTFQKWIYQNYNECIVLGGKAADMKNAIIEYLEGQRIKDVPFKPKYPKIILMNLPMTFNIDYFSPSGVEEIKDMFFYSGKYKGGMVCGPPPIIIIFANVNLAEKYGGSMATDRWRIRKLPNGPGKEKELDSQSWEDDYDGPLDAYGNRPYRMV